MAHLWTQGERDWEAFVLEPGVVDLINAVCGSFGLPADWGSLAGREKNPVVQMVSYGCGSEERWALLAGPGCAARVNGRPVRCGIQVLEDRDEVRIGGRAAGFFSTERPPRIEAYDSRGAAAACPRCKQGISEGKPVVRCPQCAVAHHQESALPCWTGYETEPFERCALCAQPATLDAGYSWSPEDL